MAPIQHIVEGVKCSQFDGTSVTDCCVPKCVGCSSCLSCLSILRIFLTNVSLHHHYCSKEDCDLLLLLLLHLNPHPIHGATSNFFSKKLKTLFSAMSSDWTPLLVVTKSNGARELARHEVDGQLKIFESTYPPHLRFHPIHEGE